MTVTQAHNDDFELDGGLDGYVPPPFVPPATLDERLVKAWREITRTPGRAALAVVDLGAMAGFVAALRAIPVTTADSAGPLRAQCGISFYVTGASNRAVDAACRYAFASRLPQLLGFALVATLASSLLVLGIIRPPSAGGESRVRTLWREITSTPSRAALATFDIIVLVAAIAAAQPVAVATGDARGALRARCGLGYYVFGSSNAAVDHACRSAFAPRASVFLVTLVLLVGDVTGLVLLLRRRATVDTT